VGPAQPCPPHWPNPGLVDPVGVEEGDELELDFVVVVEAIGVVVFDVVEDIVLVFDVLDDTVVFDELDDTVVTGGGAAPAGTP